MDAKNEAIMQDVAKNWPYKDVAKKRLKILVDRTLTALEADQRAKAILNFLRIPRPENKHEFQSVIKQVLDFEQLWFFQRLWRYLTTDIAQVLALYRISDLFDLKKNLQEEGNLSDTPFKHYESRSQDLSWFARLITPTIPGLQSALSEALREYQENDLLSKQINEEISVLESKASDLWIDISDTLSKIMKYSSFNAYLEDTLQWQGGSAKPEWEPQEDWIPDKALRTQYRIRTPIPKRHDASNLCKALSDNNMTKWRKSNMVFRSLLEKRVTDLQESLNSAKINLQDLKDKTENLRPKVRAHIQNIDRIEHEKFIEEVRKKALDTVEETKLAFRVLISTAELKAHRPSTLP